jgi:hypothetical protein
MRSGTAFLVLIGLAGGLLAVAPAEGTVIYWNDSVSGNWSDPANWLPEQVPGPGDVVFIAAAGNYTVTMDVDADIDRMSLGWTTGTQTLAMDGRALTINSGISTVLSGGQLQLSNGSSITGSGLLSNDAELNLDSSSISVDFTNRDVLQIAGICSIDGSLTTTDNSTITVGSAGELTVAGGFTNNNYVFLSGDSCVLGVTDGTLTNAPGCFIFTSGAGSPRTLAAELDNQGTVTVSAELILAKDSATHSNSGVIYCLNRDLTVVQTGSDPSFSNSGTVRIGEGHAVSVSGGVFENASAGKIFGEGTLDVAATVFTNGGEMIPGFSPATFTLTGDYTQTSGGLLSIELGGLTAGEEFDVLAVSGQAALDGALDVSLIGGFLPSDGESFEILTYAGSAGVFADTSSLEIGNGITLVQEYGPSGLTLVAHQEPDFVAPVDPGICITPINPCLTIPFEFIRVGTDEVRAYTVTFSIGPELQLCDGMNSIVEGPFLSDFCGGECTFFQAQDNQDGSFTVDGTILGESCGPDSSGTLFTVDVTHAGSDGTGAMTVNEVIVRDCDNGPVPAWPGPGISIGIDVAFPPDITDLAATQVKSGNDSDGTTGMTVTFSGDTGNDTVEIFRQGFGDYPEYDDGTGEVPTPPATPADALAEGWTLTTLTESGQIDEPAERDYWYYIVFVTSDCDLQSVSNMTDGTLNYHLGDVCNGVETCAGDNLVNTVDISFLGAHYFENISAIDSLNCLDVGPTDDFSVDGLPLTDDEIDFEDLVLFGMNFGSVSLRTPSIAEISPPSKEDPRLILSVDGLGVGPNSILTARLELVGNQSLVKGIHSLISYDPRQMKLLDVSPGELLLAQGGGVFFDHLDGEEGVCFDAVVLGSDLTFSGSGNIAVFRFQTRSAATLPVLELADLRDAQNRFLLDADGEVIRRLPSEQSGQTPQDPAVTQLLGARPNPFGGNTDILFRLATESAVSLRIFDVSGRVIRTLADQRFAAGEHRLSWDGKSDSGQSAASGIYFCTFRAGGVGEQRDLFLFR